MWIRKRIYIINEAAEKNTSSLICIHEYQARYSGGNASQRSRVGAGMSRSARGWSVKRFKRS